jgi:hypothetical protein
MILGNVCLLRQGVHDVQHCLRHTRIS